jgi:PKD repeat protein
MHPARLAAAVAVLVALAMVAGRRPPARALAQAAASIDVDVVAPRQGVVGLLNTWTATVKPTSVTDIVYTWDFGDGAAATGARVSHTFAAPGAYTVRATASSLSGAVPSNSERHTINVVAAEDLPPLAGADSTRVWLAGPSGAEPFGFVDVRQDDSGEFQVVVHLQGAKHAGAGYGISACNAAPDGALTCVPPGSALGVRFCQTQNPNTGLVYCNLVDDEGDWPDDGWAYSYPDLPFVPNLVLLWCVNDGTDYYLAPLSDAVPDQLQITPVVTPTEPDDD